MKEKETDLLYKSIIEKARKDSDIIEICHHEYLGGHGEFPPKDWEPSDKEILAIIERIGIDSYLKGNLD
jgi:hypothetical protein